MLSSSDTFYNLFEYKDFDDNDCGDLDFKDCKLLCDIHPFQNGQFVKNIGVDLLNGILRLPNKTKIFFRLELL